MKTSCEVVDKLREYLDEQRERRAGLRILALDCATKTGWAFYGDGRIVFDSHCLNSSKKRENGETFMHFNTFLEDALAKFKPSVIAYERPHLRGAAPSIIGVGLSTRIEEQAYMRGIKLLPVRSRDIQEYAKSRGVVFPESHFVTKPKFKIKDHHRVPDCDRRGVQKMIRKSVQAGGEHAHKRAMMDGAKRFLGCLTSDDNQADALWLLHWAMDQLTIRPEAK